MTKKRLAMMSVLGVSLIIFGISLWLFSPTKRIERATKQIAQAGMEAVKQRLIDPDSANFRNLQRPTRGNSPYLICGQVNSKNRMGGYTGFTDFAVFVKGRRGSSDQLLVFKPGADIMDIAEAVQGWDLAVDLGDQVGRVGCE